MSIEIATSPVEFYRRRNGKSLFRRPELWASLNRMATQLLALQGRGRRRGRSGRKMAAHMLGVDPTLQSGFQEYIGSVWERRPAYKKRQIWQTKDC